jgi:HK97 family phage portal protein
MSLNNAFIDMTTPQKRSTTSDSSFFGNYGGLFSLGTGGVSKMKADTALKLSAVYNAVDQISNDIAKIPFAVYRKDGQNRTAMPSHPANKLVGYEPNYLMTSFIFRKTIATSLLLRGNGLARIITNAVGDPVSTDFINWDNVKNIRIKNGELLYDVNGYKEPLMASEVLHFKNFSHNGIVGVGVITYAAQQLCMALEVQTYSATNYENKGVRQGVVETDKVISKDTSKLAIATAIQNAFSQKDATRVAVLDEGMKWKGITITPQELQIIEQSQFNIEDIARWFNIAPHKIKLLKQSTNNNIEQQSLDHVSDTIQPYITNFEQEYAKKLFTAKERIDGYYVRGNINVLLRADIKSRGEFISKMVTVGVMTRNEARANEDMNAGSDFLDEHLTPVNVFTEKQIANSLKKPL